MKHETTINIDSEILERLSKAAEGAEVTRICLISSLLNYMGKKFNEPVKQWTGVRYQERQEKKRWRRIHLVMRSDEYEFFLDLKKISKMSVSFLIAYSIEQYLEELLSVLGKKSDNYRYHNYASSSLFLGDVPCYVLYWGIPTEILREEMFCIPQRQ